MLLPFSKMHGIGNDFIVVPWASPEPLPQTLTARLCDRHTGIGADGILLICPSDKADAQMIVLNADGSRPEMCGNGLRCAAFHVAASACPPPASVSVSILTDVGVLACHVEYSTRDTAEVTADIGFYSDPTPVRLTAAGQSREVDRLDVGNPHAVLFPRDAATTFDAVASAVVTHPDFSAGVNASVASVLGPNHLQLRVWERGVGPTLACATAACAAAAAAAARGLVDPSRPIEADLPGGRLAVELHPDTHAVRIRGAAARVFDGTIRVD